MRPPGDRTRKLSLNTASLSGERQTTQLEMITSTLESGMGIFSISPCTKSTFSMLSLALLARASSSMAGVMSSPVTLPVSPTCWDARKQSMPPPEPRSSTRSPGCRPARAVGLPQPAEAAIDSIGSPLSWPSLYSSMAWSRSSTPQQSPSVEQPQPSDSVFSSSAGVRLITRSARAP